MSRKLRIVILTFAFIFSLCLTMKNLPTDSWLSWKIGTIKSELWAANQKISLSLEGKLEPASELEPIPTLAEARTTTSPLFTQQKSLNKSGSNDDFFPLGWYDNVENLNVPNRVSIEGIDTIVPYTGKNNASKVKAYLDRAAKAGVKVMVEIPRLEVRRDHRWLITQFVAALKNHPAVYGWYLYDEPEFTQISPALLKRVYDAIKTEDQNHPVAIAFGRLERAKPYLPALDTLIYFNYPCYAGSSACNFEQDSFKRLAAEAATLAPKGKFWMALQGYGEDKQGNSTQFNRRLPSLEEQRYMIYTAALAPANGLLFWTHYRSQQQWIDQVLTPLVKEFRTYLPAITNRNGVVPNVVNDSKIQTKLFRHPQTGNLLLIAINHSNRTFTARMRIHPEVRVNSAQVAAENRTVAVRQSRLSDVFKPFSVHVYQLQSN